MTGLPEDLMDKAKRKRLEEAGWAIGSAADFLDLSADEAAFVDLKLALSENLRARREHQGLSQAALAKKLGSSQSRVAKMEASDPSVSVDLLIRGLLAAGASRKEIASAIAPMPTSRRQPTAAKRRTNVKS
jgi:DNA-binding XRE family transcriptional regulator